MSDTPEEHIEPTKNQENTQVSKDQKLEISPVSEEVENNQEDNVSEKSRRHFKYRGTTCLNCTQPLDVTDRYCPYCSQLNSTKPLSLKDFFLEFLSSLVSYDSRLRYTVKDLLFKPGTITRNYINGQRLKYSNPFRFFLSVSIIYFLLHSIIGFFNPKAGNPFNINMNKNEITLNDQKGKFYFETDDKEVEKAIEALQANPSTKKFAEILRKEDSIRRKKEKQKQHDIRIVQGDTINNHDYNARIALLKKRGSIPQFFEKFNLFQDFYKDTQIGSSSIALDSLGMEQTNTNVWLYSKNRSIEKIEKDPVSFAEFLLNKTPFFLFFFAPLFALFFSLIYIRRPYSYMEHLVFIFHIFSFIFLVLLLTAIPNILLDTDIFVGILFGILGPFYFYKALRNFYKQSRLKTIIKFVFLNFVFVISATLAASLFFLATAATY